MAGAVSTYIHTYKWAAGSLAPQSPSSDYLTQLEGATESGKMAPAQPQSDGLKLSSPLPPLSQGSGYPLLWTQLPLHVYVGFTEQTELRKQINNSFIVLPVWVGLPPVTRTHSFSSHTHKLKSKSHWNKNFGTTSQ